MSEAGYSGELLEMKLNLKIFVSALCSLDHLDLNLMNQTMRKSLLSIQRYERKKESLSDKEIHLIQEIEVLSKVLALMIHKRDEFESSEILNESDEYAVS